MKAPGQELTLPMPAEKLIPHRPPMRLVETLLSAQGDAAVVTATVAADGPLTGESGRLEGVGLVEMLAQAYAAFQGYEDRRRGDPVRQGFLVGVRGMRLYGEALAGDRLEIRVRTLAQLEGFALAEGEIWRGTERLAAGSIKLWISSEPAEAA